MPFYRSFDSPFEENRDVKMDCPQQTRSLENRSRKYEFYVSIEVAVWSTRNSNLNPYSKPQTLDFGAPCAIAPTSYFKAFLPKYF